MKCDNCKKYDDCATGSGLVWPCGAYVPRVFTNSDRFRAMSDEDLAAFIADQCVTVRCLRLADKGYTPTATEIKAIRHTLYCDWMRWLQQPAKEEQNYDF